MHGTEWDDGQKSALRLSVCVSLLSLTKAYAELDKQGKAIRVVEGVTTAAGSCPLQHPAMFLVGLYRLVSVGSRLILFPVFQELTHDLFQVTFRSVSVSYGAALLLGIDLGVQGLGIWWRTRSLERLVFAIPSLLSPLEPVLHGGRPMLGAGVNFVACSHAVEAALACAAVVYLHGLGEAWTQLGEDAALLAAFAAFSLLQYPLLALLRLGCAYGVPEQALTLGDAISRGVPLGAAFDDTDRRTPMALVDLGLLWKDLAGKGLDDGAAEVLAEALCGNKTLERIDLQNNKIGDEGAKELARALKANTSLETILLAGNARAPPPWRRPSARTRPSGRSTSRTTRSETRARRGSRGP